MRPERLVYDSSPIIALARAGWGDLLHEVGDALIPNAVATEIEAGPPRDPARLWLAGSSLPRIPAPPSSAAIQAWGLGAGETAVLACVADAPAERLAVLDDKAARRCAEALGLRVTGTMGLLLRARQSGVLGAVSPVIGDLIRAGLYVDDRLARATRAQAGE